MRRIESIHFVGIGGSGMGGIAEVLLKTIGLERTGVGRADSGALRTQSRKMSRPSGVLGSTA